MRDRKQSGRQPEQAVTRSVKAALRAGALAATATLAVIPARHPVASPLPRLIPPAMPRATPDGLHQVAQIPPDGQAQLARAFNASVPLARGTLTAARPFHLRATAEHLARATDCLAAAGYYEAGTGVADQRAVAQVVLNRVRHRAFPTSVCEVVFQGSERRTGCQFTFTCDGSLLRRTPSAHAWQAARRVAAEMLLGEVEPAVGLATHYHTDWVSPAWDRTMDKIAAVHTHLFYRWRGPQTFEMRHSGNEPDIPMLARISDAHRTGAGEKQVLPTQLLPSALTPQASLPASSPRGAQTGIGSALAPPPPNVFLVTLPASGTPASFRAMARERCAGITGCRFIGWTDALRTPRALPMPGSAVDTIAFIYERRQASDTTETVRWDCARFAPEGTGHCI
ncbi:cell wall hydrolase [Novosphingobium guangzhouense]|uniref:Cell wall hydrolase n=1 Tax=Novosphingobium guangzhouense TaxID=1850347 RepID=A0A2K2G012_9SPHN|nr:cell wall hydrolase [Novosphingobium guangzhouense]